MNQGQNALFPGVSSLSAVPAHYLDAAHAKLTALWPFLADATKEALLFLAEGAASRQQPVEGDSAEGPSIRSTPRLPAVEPVFRPTPRGKGVQE